MLGSPKPKATLTHRGMTGCERAESSVCDALRMDLNGAGLDLWRSLVSAVRRALGELPDDAAELTVDDENLNIHIRPRHQGAADIDIGFDGVDEVLLEVGLTDAHLWQVDSSPLDETIYRIVAAVAAGDIEETGSFTATARADSAR